MHLRETAAADATWAIGGEHLEASVNRPGNLAQRQLLAASGFQPPQQQLYCALELPRADLDVPHHRLNEVADHLKLVPLRHHGAGADATACATGAVHSLHATTRIRS